MTETEKHLLISAAETIAKYCRNHICTDCPLNLAKRHDSILNAVCLCDKSVNNMPSTWRIEDLNRGAKK